MFISQSKDLVFILYIPRVINNTVCVIAFQPILLQLTSKTHQRAYKPLRSLIRFLTSHLNDTQELLDTDM